MTVRRGFTLVELLVVIAVIGVLVGLILPAVQAAREAARRTQCQDHLQQQGIALHTYMTAFDSFPIGQIAWPKPPGAVAPGWAWAASILPGLDQGSLHDSINVSLPIDVSANRTARSTRLTIYNCPGDPRAGAFTTSSTFEDAPIEAQTISYAANQGLEGSARGNGLFTVNKAVSPKDVRDGLSHTLSVGERSAFVVQNAWAGALSDGRGSEQVLARVTGQLPKAANSSGGSFAGPHPALVLFLMGDGSVRPIREGVSPAVYRALATRNGRESIDAGSF